MTRCCGRADLHFERRGDKTVLARADVNAPMAAIRPFAMPDGRLVVQLIALGPGLCGGDRLEISVTAGDGTHVVITTTSATRVLTMGEGERAEQHVRLHAGPGATLEYYPRVTIPFPGSAFAQTVAVTAAATARAGVLECWALGRTARDEYLAFRSLDSRTTLHVDGAPAYTDAMLLEPGAADLAGTGLLAGRRYAAAGFWQQAILPPEPDEEPALAGLLATVAQARPTLAYLRALGDDGPQMDRLLQRSVERVARSWALDVLCLKRFQG